jgi:spore maturation protein CgeB
MRIFCAVRHSVDPAFYYGALWSGNFYPALRELGYEIAESAVDLLPASRFMHIADDFTPEEFQLRSEITQRLIEEVTAAHRRAPINLFLSYFYNAHFDPAGFEAIRQLGIPSVNFFCNNIHQFNLVRDIAPHADFSWHAERDARSPYLAVGANPVWVQMAADPGVYRPIENIKRERVAVFVGQRYADRDRWAAALIAANVPLALYGPGWEGFRNRSNNHSFSQHLGRASRSAGSPRAYLDAIAKNWRESGSIGGTLRTLRQFKYRRRSNRLTPLFAKYTRGSIPFEKQRDIFSGADVVLNFSNVWSDGWPGSKLISHVRLRDFEAPMCRSCYLTGHSDEIAQFYEIGKEIDTYRTVDELIDKARFYFNNPDCAEKLRQRGYARATSDHTWRRRFEELFSKIGITRAGNVLD